MRILLALLLVGAAGCGENNRAHYKDPCIGGDCYVKKLTMNELARVVAGHLNGCINGVSRPWTFQLIRNDRGEITHAVFVSARSNK